MALDFQPAYGNAHGNSQNKNPYHKNTQTMRDIVNIGSGSGKLLRDARDSIDKKPSADPVTKRVHEQSHNGILFQMCYDNDKREDCNKTFGLWWVCLAHAIIGIISVVVVGMGFTNHSILFYSIPILTPLLQCIWVVFVILGIVQENIICYVSGILCIGVNIPLLIVYIFRNESDHDTAVLCGMYATIIAFYVSMISKRILLILSITISIVLLSTLVAVYYLAYHNNEEHVSIIHHIQAFEMVCIAWITVLGTGIAIRYRNAYVTLHYHAKTTDTTTA